MSGALRQSVSHDLEDHVHSDFGTKEDVHMSALYPKTDNVRYSLAYTHNSYSYTHILLVLE